MVFALRRVARVAGAPARWLLISVVRLYQHTLSGWLGGQCRFHPSCSEYAVGAIRGRGAVVGSALAVWRIVRCSPLSRGGLDDPPAAPAAYDRVPPREVRR